MGEKDSPDFGPRRGLSNSEDVIARKPAANGAMAISAKSGSLRSGVPAPGVLALAPPVQAVAVSGLKSGRPRRKIMQAPEGEFRFTQMEKVLYGPGKLAAIGREMD